MLEAAALMVENEERNFYTRETSSNIIRLARAESPERLIELSRKYPMFSDRLVEWGFRQQTSTGRNDAQKPLVLRSFQELCREPTVNSYPVPTDHVYPFMGRDAKLVGNEIHTCDYSLMALLEIDGYEPLSNYRDNRTNGKTFDVYVLDDRTYETFCAYVKNSLISIPVLDFRQKLQLIIRRHKNMF